MTQPRIVPGSVLILVADDEEPIASVVASLVEDLGYEARVAGNGRQALELARDTWPALVITDLMMPQLDGAELIVALHDEAAATGRPEVPVILMTAAGAQHARASGAHAVVSKPFDLSALETLIERLVAEMVSRGT